jgi:RNA polymerase sigma factor (sigma-70 family)
MVPRKFIMSIAPQHPLLQHLRRLIGCPGAAGVSDRQLLERFLTARDDAAFELLVWRHGPMVLNLCGRVLKDEHAAEDAFQATFLKLAHKAATIADGDSVSSWLYKVAFRTALRAREQADNISLREQPLDDLPAACSTPGPDEEAAWRELRPVLDAEVRKLPEKYRNVFILCCLQGLTNEQAAQELGCPKGTVLSRLARARERLRKRLSRKGLAVGLFLPFLAARCGERVLSQELVSWALQKVTAALGSTGVKRATGKWVLGSPTAVLVALGTILAVVASGTGAFFYFKEADNATVPTTVPAGITSTCCGQNTPCHTDPAPPLADPHTDPH